MTIVSFAQALLWCVPLFNILGLASQARKNYASRSTAGVSFWMLWLCHAASFSFIIHCYLLSLPLSLRILIPVEGAVITLIVAQEMWYAPSYEFRRFVMVRHAMLIIIASLAWYAGLFHTRLIGIATGWIGVVAVGLAQFPQIVFNWQRKSLKGYSIGWQIGSTIAAASLAWCSWVLSLPFSNVINGLRALVIRAIMWVQFFRYRRTGL